MLFLLSMHGFQFEVVQEGLNVIALEFQNLSGNEKRLLLTFVYVPPHYNEKASFWPYLAGLIEAYNGEWKVIGDINEILYAEENEGGKHVQIQKSYLKDFLDASGGMDLGASSLLFTWKNGRIGR